MRVITFVRYSLSIFLTSCFLLLTSYFEHPVSAGDRVLTLQEAYTLALKGHEAIKMAEEGLYQFEQAKRKAVSNILPVVTVEGSYTKFSEEKTASFTPTAFSVIQPDYTYNYSVKLSLPLYRGGREWSALRQAGYMVEAGERGFEITREDIIMAVSQGYYGALKIEKEAEIKGADLARAEERGRVASARFRVGEVTKSVVLRAEAETAGIQAEIARVRRDLLVANERLARLVGLTEGFRLAEPPGEVIPSGGIDELTGVAVEKRDDYLKNRAEVEIAREGVKFARGGFMPTVKLDGVYSGRGQDPISSAFFNKESIFATITVTFPLYEGGLRMAEVREAESKMREAELRRVSLRKDIGLEVREAFYTLDAINSAIEFYRREVSFAEENYNSVFKQFTYGLAINADVIDANSTLVAAQESLANSTIDLQLAIIELKRRMGMLMEDIAMSNE